jgi:hypothetical protein
MGIAVGAGVGAVTEESGAGAGAGAGTEDGTEELPDSLKPMTFASSRTIIENRCLDHVGHSAPA